jgi:lysine-ketoglutarate reductase/saccharopine dehydrogenase-like protein (TIGR00300 family)
MARSIVEISGHIIDSLILPKVLDIITNFGAEFEILEIKIGQRRADRSHARVQIDAPSPALLDRVLAKLKEHGAIPASDGQASAQLEPAPADGVLPERFYATTNLLTWISIDGRWVEVERTEMDCAIRFDREALRAECMPMHRVGKGDLIVVGHHGVKIQPVERQIPRAGFEFMSSAVSTEQPKGFLIQEIADAMKKVRCEDGRILIVAGPGLVHTGGARHLVRLIEAGYVQVIFAGNGLAVHDIENALYGTSLGVYLDKNIRASEGHEHHLWAINAIRRAGSIKDAVDSGLIQSGIFYSCVKKGVDFVLAGSIRDDGPLPDVITDTLRAQETMREKARGVGLALMMATTLHAIATGNLLPATVKNVGLEIKPALVTKLTDSGTFQEMGLVKDDDPLLRALCQRLDLGPPAA